MTKSAAYREAGFVSHRNWTRTMALPHVKARYDQLMAQRAAQTEVTVQEITEGLREVIAKNRDGDTAALQAQTRQAYMDLAKLHGHLTPKALAAAQRTGGFDPSTCACGGTGITKVRWVIVEPDGREVDVPGMND